MSGIGGISTDDTTYYLETLQQQAVAAEKAQNEEALLEETLQEQQDSELTLPIDKVEISMVGRAYATSGSAPTSTPPAGGAPTAAASSSSATSAEDEDESSSYNIYTMTETQMRDLVREGTISRSEMDAELARRGAAATEEA